MPKMINEFPLSLAFRLSEYEMAKLDALASQTGRPRAELLRRMIRLTEATGLPELRFSAEPQTPAEAGDVVHAG